MRAKPKPTRNTFTPELLVKQLAKDVPGFKSETPQVQAALASLVWIGATKLRQHTVHDGYMSFHHTELAAQFGGQFKAINARLGFLEVKDTWRWSADGKAADVFTKGYRFSPVVQASREAFLAKRVTRLSKLLRLLDATGTGFRTPPKAVASTDMAGTPTTRWRAANDDDSLSLVPVDIEALKHLQRDLAKIGKPTVNERFADPGHTTPTSVNAAYDTQFNGIDISAAIVQPPFFTPGADPVVNYCTMGAVLGHELTHGFDSMGRQYDPRGNLRDWWTPQATAEFKKRNDVLVAQYNQFQLLPGLKLDGALTLGENTADLGGITLAHAALHRALKGKPQPKVDGLSTDQRCFVAWAQLWIFKAREEYTRMLAAIDVHGNSVVRGYAPLMNLDAFHQAFGTRPGDAMWRKPADRVRIW